ncbi:MAG TPA: IS1380 family transposase [Thermodesulfobacteriota bacterium]|nr:IS1380 family transposase [Thermodesulfobacteriota bacterium]
MIQQTVFPFKIETTKERLTAHGGLALMAEFNHGIGLRGLTDRYLPGPGSHRGFGPSEVVDAVVLMLQGGGRSLEDLRELKREEGLMELMGREEIPEPDTVGDWLRRMGDPKAGQPGLEGLDRVRDKINGRVLKRDGNKEYTLDADATEIVSEKADALFTYNGNKGYMPMLGFLYEAPVCLLDEFREGNVSPAFGQKEFYIRCKQRMPRGKRIGYYRGDSASYQAGLLNQLEEDGVRYGITVDQDQAVKSAIGLIPRGEWKEPVVGCGYELGETVHCMRETKKAFRLVVRREIRRQGELFEKEGQYFYHAVATSWLEEEKNTEEVLRWHNQRGQAENFNKELKIGFGMERMPCGQSYANAVFFRIGVIAYNLFIGFKRLSCPASWMKQTIATFRWKMVQVAGRIVKHAGGVVLKLMIDLEKLELFQGVRKKSFELSVCPEG